MITEENGNPRKKAIKPTRAEYRERVDICRQLLCAHQTDGAIKKAVAVRYDISTRSVERYLRRARDILLDEINKTPDEMRSMSYETYRKIISDPNAHQHNIIAAQKQMDKLFGLNGPIKVAQTDTEGNDLNSLSEARDEISAILSALRKRAGGSPAPAGNGYHSGEAGLPGEN